MPYRKQTNVNLLLSGYSRNHIGRLSNGNFLSLSVLNVIKLYYPKMNGFSFTWKITNPQTIQNILQSGSTNQNSLDSDVFDCGISNKFFLQIQKRRQAKKSPGPLKDITVSTLPTPPYADNIVPQQLDPTIASSDQKEEKIQNVHSKIALNLMALPLPPKYSHVIFHCELYFHEQNAEYSAIWDIKSKKKTKDPSRGYYAPRRQTDDNDMKEDNSYIKFPWNINCNFSSIDALESMTFEVKINILKIVPDKTPKMQGYAYYPQPEFQNSDSSNNLNIYSYESLYNDELQGKLKFFWEINNFKRRIDEWLSFSHDIQFHSDVFYDMIQLKMKSMPGNARFAIRIVGLPRNTHKMGVKVCFHALVLFYIL